MRWYISLIIIALLIMMTPNRHECRWSSCPYKGIYPSQWVDSVNEHGGPTGSDGYEIDILHLKYPTYEYDKLDSMLFNITYTL